MILACNHISDADPLLIGAAALRPTGYMAKRELWQIGWLAPILDLVGSFPVDPASPDRAALRRAEGILELGEALVVFPEGRIAPDGKLAPFAAGRAAIGAQKRRADCAGRLGGREPNRALRPIAAASDAGAGARSFRRADFARRPARPTQTNRARCGAGAVGNAALRAAIAVAEGG